MITVADCMLLVLSVAAGLAAMRFSRGDRLQASELLFLPYFAQAPGFLLLAAKDMTERAKLRLSGHRDDASDRSIRNFMACAGVMFGLTLGVVLAMPDFRGQGTPLKVLLIPICFLTANGFLAFAFIQNLGSGSVRRMWLLGSVLLINLPPCLIMMLILLAMASSRPGMR